MLLFHSDYQRIGLMLHTVDTYPATCINGPFFAFLLSCEEEQSDESYVIICKEKSDVSILSSSFSFSVSINNFITFF